MTSKLNQAALGLTIIGALVLGGCSGQQTSTSTTTEKGTPSTSSNYGTSGNYGTTTTEQNKTATNNYGEKNTTGGTNTANNTDNTNGTNTAQNEKKNQTYELSLLDMTKQAKLGEEVTLKAKADPGTKVKIEANGAGFDLGLGDQTANDKGEVAWKWKIDKNYKADKMPVILTAAYDNLDKKLVEDISIEQNKNNKADFNAQISSNGDKTVRPGEQINVKVKTAPNADVKLEAQGAEGMGPGSKKADKNGIAEFSYKIDKNYKGDKAPLIATIDLNGKEKKAVETFEVPNKLAMKGKNNKNL